MASSPDRRRRSRSGRLRDALIWGALLGAAGGAVLGDAIGGLGAAAGALIGALLLAPAEAYMAMTQRAAEPRPLLGRIVASALLMALLGWLLGLIYGSGHVLLTAIISGGLLGLLGLRPRKLALGLAVGAVVGLALRGLDDSLAPAVVAAAVTVAYRVIAALVYRDRPLVRIMAEEVPPPTAYVVPFEARSRYVGADYVEQLAEVRGGSSAATRPTSGSSRRSTACAVRPSTPVAWTR